MGKKYFVEELDEGEELIAVGIVSIIGIGLLIYVNWIFIQSLTKIDSEIIGILIGIAISLLASFYIFIVKIKDGLYETIEATFKYTFLICFLLMLIGSIVSPIIVEYIDFILWDFIKILFFNSLILIISTPLVTLLITIVSNIIGLILAYPIYKILYIIKSKRIKRTDCWKELKAILNKIDFKNNIKKFTMYKNRIEFNESNNIKLFSFEERGYNDLKKIQQLTLINMIKKETKTPLKISVAPYEETIVYNRILNKKEKREEKKLRKLIKKEKQFTKDNNRRLERENKKAYKKAVKSGKNW